MSPSEYQELTAFFVERLDRHQRETRADLQDLRSFIGVSVESLQHEIRIVADGVLVANRRIDENTRAVEEHSRRLDENTDAIAALTERVGRLETSV